jgi:hypothetical protein
MTEPHFPPCFLNFLLCQPHNIHGHLKTLKDTLKSIEAICTLKVMKDHKKNVLPCYIMQVYFETNQVTFLLKAF